MFLEHLIEQILPTLIAAIDLIGILVVVVTVVRAFGAYLHNLFSREQYDIKLRLADGLATGLEFKMAAEILKTVLVRELNELFILGAVILLRALLSLLLHWEMKGESAAAHREQKL